MRAIFFLVTYHRLIASDGWSFPRWLLRNTSVQYCLLQRDFGEVERESATESWPNSER